MNDLISRKALLKELDGLCNRMSGTGKQLDWVIRNEISVVVDIVNKSPAVEAEPVRNGEWVPGDYYDTGDVCSKCDWDSRQIRPLYNYCPNCGTLMDGGAKDAPL